MLLPSQIKKRRYFLYYIFIGALILGGVTASAYIYSAIDNLDRLHIVDRANTIATMIEPQHISLLSGTEQDVSNPEYVHIKNILTNVRRVNHDVRFIYLVGKTPQGKLFFYGDSEDPSSKDYSPPGQFYDEAPVLMTAVFTDGQSRSDIYKDRWGSWVSGYAPVLDETGRVVAMLGIDTPAQQHFYNLFISSFLPLLVTIILVIIVWVIMLSRKKEYEFIEQKSEFLSIASHEMRTPLTGIRWAMENILNQKNSSLDEGTRKILSLVYENSIKLIARVNNLLSVTNLEAGGNNLLKKEITPIKPMIKEIVDSLFLSAQERGVSVYIDPTLTDESVMFCDQQNMHHVFFNLISNTIKYTNPNTTVSVMYEKTSMYHIFRVNDQGKGLNEFEQKHIFDGYHRSEDAIHSNQQGSGLGLYLTKKVVGLHGGIISVESAPGEKTTFTVKIPV